jgi:hypothetical protein
METVPHFAIFAAIITVTIASSVTAKAEDLKQPVVGAEENRGMNHYLVEAKFTDVAWAAVQ